MAPDPYYGISLCSGGGMLDEAVGLVLDGYRPICHVEREIAACEVLGARMEEGSIPSALIWDDLATFDGKRFRGSVPVVTAGLPCQPFSVAGKQAGTDDERYIWPEFFRIMADVRAAVVFIENVPGFVRFFRPIGEELGRMGYEFEAGIFSAEECGASHKRERFFCLAYAPRDERAGRIIAEIGRWRGVREAGASMGHSRRKREFVQQRNHGTEHQGAVGELANARCERDERRGAAEHILRSNGNSEGEACERKRSRNPADDSDRELAESPFRGFGELRQSSGGDGFLDGCDGAVAHAQHAIGRAQHEEHGEPHRRDGSGRRKSDLGNSNLTGLEGRDERGCELSDERSAGPAGDPDGQLEYASDPERRASEQRRGYRESGIDAARQTTDWAGIGDALPLFAPGPSDARWPELLVRFPWLRPAISRAEAEQLIRDGSDGMAATLDGSRTHQLRMCGNGVVATTAALALIAIARKVSAVMRLAEVAA